MAVSFLRSALVSDYRPQCGDAGSRCSWYSRQTLVRRDSPMPATLSLLRPHIRDLGGFAVRRVLPAATHRTVGPFIFFDHFGPVDFPPGEGIDVRPHPHIGLATVTYLFAGAIL